MNKNILKKEYYGTKNHRMGLDNCFKIFKLRIPVMLVLLVIYSITLAAVLIPLTIHLNKVIASELIFNLIYLGILCLGLFLIMARFWFVSPYVYWSKNYSDIEKHIQKIKGVKPKYNTDEKIVIRRYDDWYCIEVRELKEMIDKGLKHL